MTKPVHVSIWIWKVMIESFLFAHLEEKGDSL